MLLQHVPLKHCTFPRPLAEFVPLLLANPLTRVPLLLHLLGAMGNDCQISQLASRMPGKRRAPRLSLGIALLLTVLWSCHQTEKRLPLSCAWTRMNEGTARFHSHPS